MTRPWFLRRLVGDARRHGGVWLAVGAVFSVVGFCAGFARLALAGTTPAAAPVPAAPAHVVAYLKDELGDGARDELRAALAKLPDVEAVRFVSPAEAVERLRRELGPRAALLEGVGADLLFPSLEITTRPAAASALARRLRRLHGIADVDLVSPTADVSTPRAADDDVRRAGRAPLVLAGVLVALAVGAAFALLRRRLVPELGVLWALGVTRATSQRPALALATAAAGVGAALGLLAAALAAPGWLGGGTLPAREAALGAAALVVLAHAATRGAMRGGATAHAR